MTKVKICGLTRPCDRDFVNEAKPEYVGFVFAESRRKVSHLLAQSLRERLDPSIIPVGVFVNEPMEQIIALIQAEIIGIVQLHGTEDEEYIKRLKTLTDAPVIKAVAVHGEGDVQKWASSSADYLLLDNPGGGTGKCFDWDLLGNIDKPFFLAGGLGIENVADAVRRVNPFAVDVSSGVETDGYKDASKIKEFIRRTRNE
ncbi:MAG: phosphoribosylanthranilate isomerase [Planctomycetaceae bacterium]|jgi:phosphoribosylanthranilate isomerase|nr:phosphoribosylanthranilate isomerase [Planctomycetaceae bacterium]